MAQYDTPQSGADVTTSFASNPDIGQDALSALNDILGLSDPNAKIVVAAYDPSTPLAAAADLVVFTIDAPSSPGAVVEIPMTQELADSKVLSFAGSEANISLSFGDSNAIKAAAPAQHGIQAPALHSDTAAAPAAPAVRMVVLGNGANTVSVMDNKSTTLVGGTGNDKLVTSGGNDTFVVGKGTDTIDGGAGFDVVKIAGKMSDYTVSKDGGQVEIDSKTTATDKVIMNHVEFVQFTDGILALASTDAEATTLKLYQGLLGRAPEQAGAQFQINAVDSGTSLTQITNGFLNSAEFQAAHPNMTDSQFVTLLYQQGLGRAPEQAGLDYYTHALAAGVSRADVADMIVGSHEADTVITNIIHLT